MASDAASERRRVLITSLESVRARTFRLLETVTDAQLPLRVHDFYSPIGWHFGHIGRTEVYWACEKALGHPSPDDALGFLFANVSENDKENRTRLPGRAGLIAYLNRTRELTLAALATADLSNSDPLLADGYAWEFALRHEYQHQETISELRQLLRKSSITGKAPPVKPVSTRRAVATTPVRMIALPGGTFRMGSPDPHGYDNEHDPHLVTVLPFEMDETPVTNADWLAFIAGGGYRRPELWCDGGWRWCQESAVTHPEYWHATGAKGGAATFQAIGLNGLRELVADEPVCGIGWYEANAYARWANKRLPTEAEWEYAATFDPATGDTRVYPWGDAEPDATRAAFGLEADHPAPVGTHPAGKSALGLLDMAGGVWEWTASLFLPYPGFRAFPYDGYSKDSMDGKHFVCRGGSWATGAPNLRSAFRNWYVPTYRQGFLGLRCAR